MHVGEDIVAYLREELAPPERARVAAHLEACPDCRRAADESRAVLDALIAGAPTPPPVDWGRYQAEVRARLHQRSRRWWARPWPTLAAAGLAAVVLVLALQGPDRRVDLGAVDEAALGARLPLLQQYRVVERLDMLEDLDVINQLDRVGNL